MRLRPLLEDSKVLLEIQQLLTEEGVDTHFKNKHVLLIEQEVGDQTIEGDIMDLGGGDWRVEIGDYSTSGHLTAQAIVTTVLEYIANEYADKQGWYTESWIDEHELPEFGRLLLTKQVTVAVLGLGEDVKDWDNGHIDRHEKRTLIHQSIKDEVNDGWKMWRTSLDTVDGEHVETVLYK
jgi:hypothetical protein